MLTHRRRSQQVQVGLLVSAMVAALGACTTQTADAPTDIEPRRCVDGQGVVVPDDECATTKPRTGLGGVPLFLWYYGGMGGLGSRATGGSHQPTPGMRAVPAAQYDAAVRRGGFGRTAGPGVGAAG